jgi:hypothetical protein
MLGVRMKRPKGEVSYLLVRGTIVLVAQHEHGQLTRILMLDTAHIINEAFTLLEAHPVRDKTELSSTDVILMTPSGNAYG